MSTTSTVILHYQDRPGHQYVKHPRSKTGSSRSAAATTASIIGRSCIFPLSLLTFLHLLTWSSCSPLIAPLIAANLNSTSSNSTLLAAVVQVPLKDGGSGGFSSTFSSTAQFAADSRSLKSASVPAVISQGNTSATIKSSQPTLSSSWTSSEISGNLSTASDWPVIAQRRQVNEVVENQERTGRASSTEHSTILLFCSANSIRYWSASCPVHASASLLIKDRSSSIPHGISSLALWRPPKATNFNSSSKIAPVQLLWYDAEEGAFQRAAIHRKRSTSDPGCDNLLGVAYNETLRFADSKDNFEEGDAEARVKLAVDSGRHLLFASRFQNSRLDVFQLDIDNSTAELEHLATVSTLHPYEIALDEREQVLFWVEDKARICRLEYSTLAAKLPTQNLTALKQCTDDLVAGPQALTLDIARQRILWGDRNGRLYSLEDYYFASGSAITGDVISHPGDPHSVNNLAMSSEALYLSDDQDLYQFNLTTGHSEVVSIESNIQFGLLVLEDLPEEEDDIVTTTTVVPMTTTTTTTSTSTANDNDHPFTESSTPNFDPSSSTSTSTLSPSLPTTAFPDTTSPSTSPSVPFLVFTLVPSLVVLLFLLLTLIICCCSHHHPVLAEAQQRLHLNPDSLKARTSAILGRRFTRYAQLRKERANSTGRDQLINDAEAAERTADHHHQCDLESAADSTSVTSCTAAVSSGGCQQQEHHHQRSSSRSPTAAAATDCDGGIINNSFYRSNIMRQHPTSAVNNTAVEDIEDILAGNGGASAGGQHHRKGQEQPSFQGSVHRPCMACRDVDICAEKGICMATYRVY